MKRCDIKDIKIFALALVTGLSLFSIKLFNAGETSFLYLRGAAVLLFFLAVVKPRVLSPLYKIFSLLGKIVGWAAANIILLLIFYLVITPLGLLAKLLRRDALGLKKNKQESYWVKNKEVFSKYRYSKQF